MPSENAEAREESEREYRTWLANRAAVTDLVTPDPAVDVVEKLDVAAKALADAADAAKELLSPAEEEEAGTDGASEAADE